MNCNDCKVRSVCEHVCGGLWLLYSHGAIGCDKPDGMETIAEAWRKAGWRDGANTTVKAAPMGGKPNRKFLQNSYKTFW